VRIYFKIDIFSFPILINSSAQLSVGEYKNQHAVVNRKYFLKGVDVVAIINSLIKLCYFLCKIAAARLIE